MPPTIKSPALEMSQHLNNFAFSLVICIFYRQLFLKTLVVSYITSGCWFWSIFMPYHLL